MRLCAEALFALNAAIDTGLLACSARLCGQKLFWRRLIAAGCLGGVYAVAAVLPELGFLRSGLVKLCAAVGMCLLSFGWKSGRSRSSSRSVSCSNERAECCAQAEKKSRQTATHNAPMAHSASALTG